MIHHYRWHLLSAAIAALLTVPAQAEDGAAAKPTATPYSPYVGRDSRTG